MNAQVRSILFAAAIIALVFLLYQIRVVVLFVAISVVITLLGRPIIKFFERKKMPSGLAAFLTLVSIVGILFTLGSILYPWIQEEAEILANIDEQTFTEKIGPHSEKIGSWLESVGWIPEGVDKQEYVQENWFKLINYFDMEAIISGIIGRIGFFLAALSSILFISFFLLKDRKKIYKGIYRFTPDKNKKALRSVLEKSKSTLSNYLLGMLIQIAVFTTLVTIGMIIIGVKNPFLIGIVAGLFNTIPYVGPIIGGFVGIILGLATSFEILEVDQYGWFIFMIFLVFAIAQLLDNFVFHPLIFSQSVNAHPLEVFLVVLSAGTLAGIGGMILAVPVYSVCKIVITESYKAFKAKSLE